MRHPLSAVLTAYRPDAGFAERFRPLLARCGEVVVVDNTPGGHRFGPLPAGFVVLQDGVNKGLGRALNDGIARARSGGAQRIVLFDQDSTPSVELIDDLDARCTQVVDRHGPRSVIAPTHLDDAKRGAAETVAAKGTREVRCLPTSGMMLPTAALDATTRFAEDLFLDLVDFEWCWRLREAGWTFLRAADIVMYHRLGIAEQRFLGLTYYVPAPYRHYFQVRDTLRLASRRYMPLYSKIRLVGVLPLKALVYPFILDHGTERLRWMLRGVRDCFRRIDGIGAARERLSR